MHCPVHFTLTKYILRVGEEAFIRQVNEIEADVARFDHYVYIIRYYYREKKLSNFLNAYYTT